MEQGTRRKYLAELGESRCESDGNYIKNQMAWQIRAATTDQEGNGMCPYYGSVVTRPNYARDVIGTVQRYQKERRELVQQEGSEGDIIIFDNLMGDATEHVGSIGITSFPLVLPEGLN